MKKLITLIVLIIYFFNGFCYAENALISEAKKHLEKPYVYATCGPNTFDCSGFTYYCVYQVFGISLKRTAYEQGYDDTYNKITNIDSLIPGDLVYFNTINDNDLSDHAGIYIGNNEFIHASSGKGEVIISNFDQTYYNSRFSWGRRIVEEEENEKPHQTRK